MLESTQRRQRRVSGAAVLRLKKDAAGAAVRWLLRSQLASGPFRRAGPGFSEHRAPRSAGSTASSREPSEARHRCSLLTRQQEPSALVSDQPDCFNITDLESAQALSEPTRPCRTKALASSVIGHGLTVPWVLLATISDVFSDETPHRPGSASLTDEELGPASPRGGMATCSTPPRGGTASTSRSLPPARSVF